MMSETTYLVDSKLYLKSGIHIGTKFRAKQMASFIYKTRPDGLSVLNLEKINDRLRVVAQLLSKYDPEEILVISRRENGWRAVRLFGKATGCRFFAGRYPPGILTNPTLETFTETKIILVTDAWPDRNAVLDALKIGVPVIALCDTNNQINGIDVVLPCNNKGKKSLGLVFYVLAKEYLKARNVIQTDEQMPISVDEFTAE
jgi:small subunit ribosomal protein S2